jgi:hypothetical protein
MFQEEGLLVDKSTGGSGRRSDMFRAHKLSNEDKLALYTDRPDLDPSFKTTRAKRKKPPQASSSGSSSKCSDELRIDSLLSHSHSYSHSYSHRSASTLSRQDSSELLGKGDGLDCYFKLSSSLSNATNQLHVALLSELALGPDSSFGSVELPGHNGMGIIHLEDSMEGGLNAQQTTELHVSPISISGFDTELDENGNQVEACSRGKSSEDVGGARVSGEEGEEGGRGDDSSEDEIDQEDEDLFLVLFPQ